MGNTVKKELSWQDLPDPADVSGVFAFAMSFNGYEELGSFEACTRAARERRRASLVDLRNELFCAARASRYAGSTGYLETYAALLPLFQHMLGAPTSSA